jgi:hypothetical protein
MPWAHDRLWTIAGGQMLGLGWEKDRFLMSTEGALRPFVAGLASLLLGYMPARTHSSQSADLVTGGGASSPADDPAACLPLPKAKCSCEGTRGTGLQTRLSRLASR